MYNKFIYLCFMKKETKQMGRPEKYGEATKILAIRVPESRYAHYRKVFKSVLDSGEGINVTTLLHSSNT